MPESTEAKATENERLDQAKDRLDAAIPRIKDAGIGLGAAHVEEAAHKLEELAKAGHGGER